MANMIRLAENSLHWVNDEILKAAKTVKEVKEIFSFIPESEHQFLEALHELFHQEDKPSTKNKGGG